MTKAQALALMPVVAVTPENAALLNEMAAAIYGETGHVPGGYSVPVCPACGGSNGYLEYAGGLEWVACLDCGLEYNWHGW